MVDLLDDVTNDRVPPRAADITKSGEIFELPQALKDHLPDVERKIVSSWRLLIYVSTRQAGAQDVGDERSKGFQPCHESDDGGRKIFEEKY